MIKHLLEEIKDDQELKQAIDEYKQLTSEVDTQTSEIQDILDTIKDKEKQFKKLHREIQKYMIRFEKDKFTTDKWVAKLEKEYRYKRITLDYRELYTWLKGKVNQSLYDILNKMEETQKELKKNEKVTNLYIEGIGDSIHQAFSWIKQMFSKLFNSFNTFNRIINNVPKI